MDVILKNEEIKMKRRKSSILSIILSLVWFYFIVSISDKYLKGFGKIISIPTTLILLALGIGIIEYFTNNKKN